MASVGSLSDSELRLKLAEYGFPVGPVTETSRKVLVKKLKHLMVQAGRSSEGSNAEKWRRSSSRFSSGEEESENEDVKSRLHSPMPPPSSNFKSLRRKAATKSSSSNSPGRMGRRKEINLRNDLFTATRTSAPESEPNKHKRSRLGVPPVTVGNSGARRSPSHATSPNVFKDGFDTGSDSDIDSHKMESNTSHISAGGDGSDSVTHRSTSSFLSRLSSGKPKQKSDDSGGGSSSSVNTLLSLRKTFPSTSTSSTPDNWHPTPTTSTPFQSNFVKRLSDWSPINQSGGSPPSIYDVKENDDVGISPNGFFSPSRWANFDTQSDLARSFKTSEEEGRYSSYSQVISMILLVVAALFFAVLAIIYVNVTSKDAISFGFDNQANRFPLCEYDIEPYGKPVNDELCLEQQEILPAIKMAKILHPELIKRAILHQCSDLTTPIMTHHDAIKYLMKKEKHGSQTTVLERYFRALKALLLINPHWGISVLDTATGMNGDDKSNHKHLVDTGALLVAHPDLPLLCYSKLLMMRVLPMLSIIVLGLLCVILANNGIKWHIRRRERQKLEMCNLVEKIIDVLVKHQQAAPNPAPVYVPVNHVRDEIIPIAERMRMAPLWKRAVQYIHDNESRIRCDSQIQDGEEVAVWNWLPHSVYKKNPSASLETGGRRNKKVWQGQAFDTMTGCPNSLTCSPTPCLKIRNMFEPDMEFSENWPIRIEDAILEKCGEQGVTALHIYVDRSNRDGCVYLKCASQDDAGRAYRALHGWWFDSHLVTVKYLRLERYHERFPEAEGASIPLCPSNNQKLSLQWQGPLEHN